MNSQIEEEINPRDIKIARAILAEIDKNPDLLIIGDELRRRLDELENPELR